MRDRHLSRLCGSCQAPLARQENACWRCGTNWATEDAPRPTLRMITEEAPANTVTASDAGISTIAGDDRAAALARLDANRWIDEGGNLGSATALPSERLAARAAQ